MPEIITSLEMTSPTQLTPGAPPPTPLRLQEVDSDHSPLIRTLYNRIWHTSGRTAWSAEQWTEELSSSTVRTWIARIDGTVAGFAELSVEPSGDVGIVVFGLVPEFQSQGYGAAFLTLTTQIAWRLTTTRVWLQTSSHDHPHALPNYQHRGFQVFATNPKPTDS